MMLGVNELCVYVCVSLSVFIRIHVCLSIFMCECDDDECVW